MKERHDPGRAEAGRSMKPTVDAPRRPVLRYHGGKWRLAPWILEFFPAHSTYVEPFGGAASILLRKPRSAAEVYNDLDDRIVNLFRVLRNPEESAALARAIELTPYARVEHVDSYEPSLDPVEDARRTVVRSMMGHGSRGATSAHRTGFRNAKRRRFLPASDWASYQEALPAIAARFRGVVVEHRDAAAILVTYDAPDTLFYVDPPYPAATRTTENLGSGRAYRHELSDDGHRRLADILRSVQGMVVLSGYPCQLYHEELYPDWEWETTASLADGRVARTEVVWLNPACAAALERERDQREMLVVGGGR